MWPPKYLIMKPPHTTEARPIEAHNGMICRRAAFARAGGGGSAQSKGYQHTVCLLWGETPESKARTDAPQGCTRSSRRCPCGGRHAGSPASCGRRPPTLRHTTAHAAGRAGWPSSESGAGAIPQNVRKRMDRRAAARQLGEGPSAGHPRPGMARRCEASGRAGAQRRRAHPCLQWDRKQELR